MEKLKQRWGLKTNLDIIAVLCVFAINGSFAAYIGKPLMASLNLSIQTTNPWLYYPVKIILITIIYQITLPIIGWFFGKYEFFYGFTKKFVSKLGLGFLFRLKK